ncbi:hypothetical protein KEM48_008588 [Puccinia striiformis f. sp. tritici PST-130]|nr:hypothetical protein KEM48_008588 [Puccinia striiformis f. sp. tritici PST-130]
MKLVSWFHQGAEPLTTDSASSNNTMAAKMFDILAEKNGVYMFDWRPENMHIRCVCHKIALIVNAGLAELGIVAAPPPKIKEAKLGPFPFADCMETIEEGDEEAEESEDKSGSDIENVEDPMDSEPEHDEEELAEFLKQQEQAGEKFVEEEIEFAATNRNEANAMDSLTKKLDFVVRKITANSAWRQVFKRKIKKKGLKLRILIAGYGIRWNIKFESRSRAYEAREVIDEMLKEDLERVHTRRARQRGQTSRKELGYFQEITILSHEWQSIKELNDELEKMEGDGPAGSIAIPEYLKLKHDLKKKADSCQRGDPLHPTLQENIAQLATVDIQYYKGAAMFVKMTEKTNTYLKEALSCETLVMSTILNPSFRLAIFESHFQAEAPRAEARLIELFDGRKNEIVEVVTQSKEHEKKSTEKKDKEKEKENDDIYSFFSGPSNEPGKDEIEMYLGGMDCMDRGEKNYTFSALKWWKEHENKYVILSTLAKDYLGCIASSASVERTFSAAADVCSGNRGKLLPRTIETLVSSCLWLRDDIPLGVYFDNATKQIENFKTLLEEKNLKRRRIVKKK